MGCCYSHNNKQQWDASVTQGGQDDAQCLRPEQATLRSGERDWAEPGSKHSFTFNTLKIPRCNSLIVFSRSSVFTIYSKYGNSKLLLGCCVSLIGHRYYVMGDFWGYIKLDIMGRCQAVLCGSEGVQIFSPHNARHG